MHILFSLLAIVAGLAALAAHIFILVEAFRDELWKGLVGLFCGLYLLYFALFDWDHEWKWPIFILYIGGGSIMYGLFRLAGGG